MTMPGMISVDRVAGMLRVPVRFIRLLQEHHVLPPGDSEVPASQLRATLRHRPWLRDLDTPMTESEMRERVCTSIRFPDMREDVGLRAAGGRRMIRPWVLLDRLWSGTHASGHE